MKTVRTLLNSEVCLLVVCVLLVHGSAVQAADSIVWHPESNTMDADIDNKPLSAVAADIKKATGREIHVPPGMSKMVSVKFAGKSTSEGLSRILDGFNYYTETHENVTRIIIIDPSNTSPTPSVARSTMPMPRPPSPGSTGAFKPPTPTGGGSGSLFGNRDSRGTGLLGNSTGTGAVSDRERAAKQQAAQEALRELYKSGGGASRSDRPRDGGSDSGRSRPPR